ncbi:MAG TPA: bifunctional [glutamine synthetase] adenylyltransferase/[glutamine synthetase]-adenylyl-L-tyrosine phosphorylase [Caulobacteraceae bacterium]|nr:bifunctional [glutamine synthetase] adenylyltransferase/[glutamine synthetase]-adenylyl-L-tyrosine phosphorylase [Caulobacteraceae bacterium]
MTPEAVWRRASPCGPILDEAAAERARERIEPACQDPELLEAAWPVLAPIFAASPYLTGLAARPPGRLAAILHEDPQARLAAILHATAAAGALADAEVFDARLRQLKGELHLLAALADLCGLWPLDVVTDALSRFADAAVAATLAQIAAEGRAAGWLGGQGNHPPGLFVLALGKLGADELNYSSDIDISVFYEPASLAAASSLEPAAAAARVIERLAARLQRRTVDGYVFRLDFRLRPDPLSTPPAIAAPAAIHYYQTVGQNWERAAFIKARPLAGDLPAAQAFLDELTPFVWRRSLDFAAIADIHAIKRQIQEGEEDEPIRAAGADLKLGRGGIREIEFFVQTQQLIHGGRDPRLRQRPTLVALEALSQSGRVEAGAAEELAGAYRRLRGIEHRIQMIGDEQTHTLPAEEAERRRVATLAGYASVKLFDREVEGVLRGVCRRYAGLFGDEAPAVSRHGPLVFTGVEDDRATLRTLSTMGFSEPADVSQTIRAWRHGRIRATRTERERELFTRFAPRLLDACEATGAPDLAFRRFGAFFGAAPSGAQIQSLFLAQPRLLDLVVRIFAFAPRLVRTLASRPAVLDALIEARFFGDIAAAPDITGALAGAGDFEAVMDEARRLHAEGAFRIGAQVLSGRASPADAGAAFAALAEALVRALSHAAMAETARQAGALDGEVAVIALGACGAREMTAASDLDLMTLYRCDADALSADKGWSGVTFFARFTQRLIAALSAMTPAGGLYDVDMRLRPSGTAGPVAVSLRAFETYYDGDAETWELQSLCRARVVWASSEAFGEAASLAIVTALRRPRDRAALARDVREMRALMDAERPAVGLWDLKLVPGGLTDVQFAVQFLQLALASEGGPLETNTVRALDALGAANAADPACLGALREAWSVQADLAQVLAIALERNADPAGEPKGLKTLLSKAGHARGFPALERRLGALRTRARAAFDDLVAG